jgi:hypothetical protein
LDRFWLSGEEGERKKKKRGEEGGRVRKRGD